MHRFNGYDIELTQGDSLRFRINLSGRELPEGTVGYFTVKRSPRDSEAVILKKMDAGDGELIIQLHPADTNLPARTYWWDVRVLIPLETGGYEVETPMEAAAFTIVEAVGDAGENNDGMDADLPVLSLVLEEARELMEQMQKKLDEIGPVTPASIGALPVSGGTMKGNLNLGNVSDAVSVILQMARMLSDGSTKAQMQMYLTGGGSLKFDLYHAGAAVCSWTVAADYVRFSKQVQLPGEGSIALGAVGSAGVVKHTLFSDKNPPAASQITGLDSYLNNYLTNAGLL